MGAARSDEKSQRAYLGKLAASFERIVGHSLNAQYNEENLFDERLDMRLITRMITLNEVFSEVFSQKGHTRHFEHSQKKEHHDQQPQLQLPEIDFEIPNFAASDLEDIICPERFQCPEPSDDSLMEHLEGIYRKSRGPDLGTVSAMLNFCNDHILNVCSLTARCWEPRSRSNPGVGTILSCPT